MNPTRNQPSGAAVEFPFGFNRLNRSTNKKKTPGPKHSSMMEMPVAMPQNVPRGAQQSSRRRREIADGSPSEVECPNSFI